MTKVVMYMDLSKDITVKVGGWPNIPATKKYTITLYKPIDEFKHQVKPPTGIPRPIKTYTVNVVKKVTSENKPRMDGTGEGWFIRFNGILTYDEANHRLVLEFDVSTIL